MVVPGFDGIGAADNHDQNREKKESAAEPDHGVENAGKQSGEENLEQVAQQKLRHR